jgi:DNA polymerase-3 subunit epsilon
MEIEADRSEAAQGGSEGTQLVLPRFSVVDIETSGLSLRRHRILQVAVVTIEDGAVADEWSSLVRLRWPWQRVGARSVHGIDRRSLRTAPERRHVLRELADRLEGSVFTAHNAAFDWSFIARAAHRDRVALPAVRQLCTLRLSRRLDPERTASHRLDDLCVRYDVLNIRPHDALHDARATAAVLQHLLAANHVAEVGDLDPLYEGQ